MHRVVAVVAAAVLAGLEAILLLVLDRRAEVEG
jgi:hypothetical protein